MLPVNCAQLARARNGRVAKTQRDWKSGGLALMTILPTEVDDAVCKRLRENVCCDARYIVRKNSTVKSFLALLERKSPASLLYLAGNPLLEMIPAPSLSRISRLAGTFFTAS